MESSCIGNWFRQLLSSFGKFQDLTIETLIVSIATKTIDVGCSFKCLPYRRLARDSVISSPLHLRRNSSYLFALCMGVVLVHVGIQWIAFVHYVKNQGMNTAACLHLNFLAIHNVSGLFALELLIRPQGMLAVQNEIYGMQTQFKTSWTHHPIILFLVPSMQMIVVSVTIITASLFVFDPTLPMFAVTAGLVHQNAQKNDDLLLNLCTAKLVIAALVETFLVFYSALLIFSVSQTCTILAVALNVWMRDGR